MGEWKDCDAGLGCAVGEERGEYKEKEADAGWMDGSVIDCTPLLHSSLRFLYTHTSPIPPAGFNLIRIYHLPIVL